MTETEDYRRHDLAIDQRLALRITMGCGDACPVYPGKHYLDWVLDDPAGMSVEDVRPVRDEIERRVRDLLHDLGVPATARHPRRNRRPPFTVHKGALMGRQLIRKLVAEYLGSLLLAAVVIGSGIAAQRLSPGDTGLQLLENAAATAAGLYAIILMFGPVSGAHFNPVVSIVDAVFSGLPWRDVLAYLPAQVAGCISGAVLANVMFAADAVSISTTHRASFAHGVSEVVATIGLLLMIFSLARSGRADRTPAAVGAYIGAAYFFTSSTSFANPAITLGRMFSDTFAGIAPASAPTFIAAQLIGAVLVVMLIRTLYPATGPSRAQDVLLPHPTSQPTAPD